MTSGSSPIVLDTSAYSWFRRGDSKVVTILQTASQILVPAIVVGELLAGFAIGSRERANVVVLSQFLVEEFVREVTVDRIVAEHYAILFAQLRANGTPIPTNDIWIAACARAKAATLVTYDRDFTRISSIDCRLLSPTS